MSENIPQIVQPQPYVVHPVGHPAAQPTQRTGMGIAALVIAIVVFVGSLLWAADNGVAMWNLLGNGGGDSFNSGFNAGLDVGSTPAGASLGLVMVLHVVLGTIAGVAAIVLGILAIALKRGRAQGVAAVIIAAVAPVASYIAFSAAGPLLAM